MPELYTEESSDLVIIGPLGIRKFGIEKVCQSHSRHCHPYDHVTIIMRGRVKVAYKYDENGKSVEGESREFVAGEYIHIKAGVEHVIKAMEANTKYLCVFSHRDFEGQVVQEYNANDLSYS
jgi:quercetin dioxygenase-like cupin family protein